MLNSAIVLHASNVTYGLSIMLVMSCFYMLLVGTNECLPRVRRVKVIFIQAPSHVDFGSVVIRATVSLLTNTHYNRCIYVYVCVTEILTVE